MQKDSGSSVHPTAPPPTAPPSYEEAIANAASGPTSSTSNPPYPVGPSGMSMPMPYHPPASQTTVPISMPMPTIPHYPTQPSEFAATTTTTQPYNARQNFAPPREGRVVYHLSYALGPNPVKMSCPTCHADIKTNTISDHQPSAHICCIVLCLLGCCLCSCLPYCMSAFMSVHHFCPHCKNYIGTWKG